MKRAEPYSAISESTVGSAAATRVFSAHARRVRRRVEVVDDVEARRALRPVDRGDVEEQVEAELALQQAHARPSRSAGASASTSMPCDDAYAPPARHELPAAA